MKQCIKCHKNKPEPAFHKHYEKGKVTYRNVCKDCYNAQRRHTDTCHGDLIAQYLDACSYHQDEIGTISKEKFVRTFHIDDTSFSMQDLEQQALARLEELGYCNPKTMDIQTEGTYLVIGDTFGKKTSTDKFRLLANIVTARNIKKVIVIGHNTDDYNDVSNAFKLLNTDIVFIPIKNELKDIHSFCMDYSNMSIVRDEIMIGDIYIKNQDYITPYVKTSLKSLDPLLYPGKVIVNCTRHELYTRAATGGQSFICSPGAMAEPHVVRVVYKMILASGNRINLAPIDRNSFLKYRKNDVDKLLWEMGCLIVHLNKMCRTWIEHVRIHNDLSCVLNDGTFVTPNRIGHVKRHTVILSDIHIPNESYIAHHMLYDLKLNKPDQIIINGDLLDMRSFNPHEPVSGIRYNFEEELKSTLLYLEELSRIAPVTIMWGNHEMFAQRFFKDYPQLQKFFLKHLLNELSKFATVTTRNPDEVYLLYGSVPTLHGSCNIFGASGTQIEKIARSVSTPAIIGHTHSPAIRFGVYCSGCLCRLDQGYNNGVTNNWACGYLKVYENDGQHYIHQIVL